MLGGTSSYKSTLNREQQVNAMQIGIEQKSKDIQQQLDRAGWKELRSLNQSTRI